MSIQGELLAMLETVAEALGDDLCRQMVFVGGCSTAVLITDEITLQEVRATDDVDLIVGLTGMAQWMQLQETLSKKGFTVSEEDEVICRMRLGNLKVDFMPDDPDILGFSNRWYKEGIDTAIKYVLPSGRVISGHQTRSLRWERPERPPRKPRPGRHHQCCGWKAGTSERSAGGTRRGARLLVRAVSSAVKTFGLREFSLRKYQRP